MKIKDFRLNLSDWIRPPNMDVWYQMLTVQTASDEQTLGVRLAVTGYELKQRKIEHPSQLPREAALDHVKTMCNTLIDHIDLILQEEKKRKNDS